MSIRSFNRLINGSGCFVVISVILAALFIVQFSNVGFFGGPQNQTGPNGSQVVLEVYGSKVTDQDIANAYSSILQYKIKNGGSTAPQPLEMTAMYGTALENFIQPALIGQEIHSRNIKITDDDLMNQMKLGAEEQVKQVKENLVKKGKLSPSATPAQISTAFKDAGDLTPDQFIAQNQTKVKQAISDPKMRQSIVEQLAPDLIPIKLQDQIVVTPDQVKATYVSMQVQRVFLTGPDADKTAAIVEQKANSGTAFTDLITQYSQDKTNTKKSASQTQISLGHSDLSSPPLNALANLKPNAISNPIHSENGLAIYKVISIAPSLPADFAKNQKKYIQDYASALAAKEYADDMAKMQNSTQVTWSSPQWKALYDVAEVFLHAPNDPSYFNTYNWSSLAAEAQKATTAPLGKNPIQGAQMAAALANYTVINQQFTTAQPTAKTALIQPLIDATNAVKAFSLSAMLDLQLANLYQVQGNKAAIPAALIAASNENIDLSETGKKTFEKVRATANIFLAQKLITPADFAQIQKGLKAYLDSSKQADEEKAQVLKAQSAAQAEQEQDKKKLEQANKNNPAPAGSPTSGIQGSAPATGSTTGANQPFGTPITPPAPGGTGTKAKAGSPTKP